MSSLAGVSVMPFMKKDFYKNLLTALVGLAVGSLAGSAVFHLLPQVIHSIKLAYTLYLTKTEIFKLLIRILVLTFLITGLRIV